MGEKPRKPDDLASVFDRARVSDNDVEAREVIASVTQRLLGKARPPTKVDRYILLERLGVGAVGMVYAAYDRELDRKVALKLLRPDRRSSKPIQDTRLAREAQALARLSHPNVVDVYHVGTHGDGMFLALEFVDGVNMRTWLTARRRTWREVLEVMIPACRGLAAAHAAGLVHRDFKPDNVLLGTDGRVRVADFGLARRDDTAEPIESPVPTPDDQPVALDTPVTREGAILGTPHYMAPEQHKGVPCDARSDQYAFGVTLFEALYGERPFRASNIDELERAKLDGPRSPGRGHDVPTWLHRILQRCLSARPGDRYPALVPLLAALEQDPIRRRRRWLVATTVAFGVAAGVLGYQRLGVAERQPCRAAEDRLIGVWDDDRKSVAKAAFVATGLGYAGETWERVEHRVDGYLEGWAVMHTDACEATNVRREQSSEVLDLRMACMNARLTEVRALVDVFGGADAKVVEHAVSATLGLSSVTGCADIEELRDRTDIPRSVAELAATERLRGKLAEVAALYVAGRFEDSRSLAEDTVAAARDLDYPPALAEALHRLGRIQDKLGDYATAEQTLSEATWLALANHHDAVVIAAATDLVWVVGNHQARDAEGRTWAKLAEAALRRSQPEGAEEALLLNGLGSMAQKQAHYAEADGYYERALEIAEPVLGTDHTLVGALHNNLGITAQARGRHQEAEEHHERGLAIRERVLGAGHPDVAASLSNIGIVMADSGRMAEAAPYHRRALAIGERALGTDHPNVAGFANNVGLVAKALGNDDEARTYLGRALAAWERQLGSSHPNVATSLTNLGDLAERNGRFVEALAHHERALSIWEKAMGADHPVLAFGLTGVGRALVELERHREAIAPLERALVLREAAEPDLGGLGRTRAVLAQALWAGGGDRKRALRLAGSAREAFIAAGGHENERVAAVDDWLASLRLPR